MLYPIVLTKAPFDVFQGGLSVVYHDDKWWFDLRTLMRFFGYSENSCKSLRSSLARIDEGTSMRVKIDHVFNYFVNFDGWCQLIAHGNMKADDEIFSSYLSAKAAMSKITDPDASLPQGSKVEYL